MLRLQKLLMSGGTLALLTASVVLAADNSYVPAAGGNWSVPGNWSLGHCPLANEHVKIVVSGTANKAVYYDWGGASTFGSVTVDGGGSYYGAIWQLDHVITTYSLYLGKVGPGWHWLEGPAYLWVNEVLYVGYQSPGPGHFYMSTLNDDSAGLYVGDLCYVGYNGPGDFDHTGGIAEIYRLYVGQSDAGTYYMRGGRLELANQFVVGNGAAGVFQQTGGTVAQTGTNGLLMGLNTGGEGTYLMQGGTLDLDHISLAWNGDAYFTQSGGTVTTVGDVNIGCQGTHPMRSWYKLGQDHGPAALNVGGNLFVGAQTLGKYEQTAGTCTVTDNLEIWKASTSGTSYVYLGTAAGLLDVGGAVVNHSGYYDQDGGVMTTSNFTNDSPEGVNIDNSADFRATALANNAGTLWMWRNAIVRGEEAMPGTFWLCNFVNKGTFQMGSAATDGGSFRGILTNHGTFHYYRGDFAGSALVNHGTVTLNADLACARWVNNAPYTLPADRHISADGVSYANAFENNDELSLSPRSQVDVAASKLVNNDVMYAGRLGSDVVHIYGNFVNNGFLLPALSSLPAGHLYVHGDLTATSAATLRTRIKGTDADDRDHVTVSGTATFAGTLDVQLTNGFVPAIGNSFSLVNMAPRREFSSVVLPALPSDRAWRLDYGSIAVTLTVVGVRQGDLNCDGAVNFGDINPFVEILTSFETWQAAHPGCPWQNGDCNHDGLVNFGDINPFVALLAGE